MRGNEVNLLQGHSDRMKTSDINEILKVFCKNQDYRAILIDGKWGIGKTYEFKKYFDSLKKKDKKRIYYFTIFGTETIDELNTSIFKKIHPIWSFIKVGYKTISKSVDAIATFKNSSLNVVANLDYLLDQSKPKNIKKDTILIFDDLERLSNNNLALFLGLLYKLNLQGARIICFISSEKLKDKEHVFEEYKEKIFDAIYRIEEPSLDVFDTTFDIISDNDQRRYLLTKCQNNIRILKKSYLLFDRITQHVGEPKNWIIDKYFVIIACCYVVQIVLSTQENKIEIDANNFSHFSKVEEFGKDIAQNFITLIKNEKFDTAENMIPGLINCILRIYLFDNYESLKHSLLKEKEKETPLLSRSFFILSDKDKDDFVSLFFEKIANPNVKYDKNDLQILGDIIRYYSKDIDEVAIQKFVEKYFDNCDKTKELQFSELVYWLIGLKDVSHGLEISRIDKVISIVKEKLKQLQNRYQTDALLGALKNKEYLFLDDFINRFDFLKKWVLIEAVKEALINNKFYLPDLSKTITENEWHFAHEISSIVHLLQLDDPFIEYAKELVKKNNSFSLKDRLEALIQYKLYRTIDLSK